MTILDIKKIEKKINKIYTKFTTKDTKYSIIEMFPYPSGNLHVGHIKNYVITDVIYRYFRLTKGECIKAIGWDSFGLPAENAARDHNISPKKWTQQNIEIMKTQIQNMSLLHDWTREISTSDYQYFQYTQKIFKIFFEKNIIFQDYYFVNWDNIDETVLANEQVINGLGWRSGTPIILKLMKSWFFNIEKYAEYLYENLKSLKWPNTIKTIQKNWIGKHEGYVIKFPIFNSNTNEYIECFTLQPQQYNNVEFICIAINHKISINFLLKKNIEIKYNQLNTFILEINKNAYNPITNNKIKIYISSTINSNYGTGAKAFAPSSSDADKKFAIEFAIKCFKSEDLKHFNNYDGNSIISIITKQKLIYKKIFYKTRLWCISRQRCWGCPIPLYFCTNCNKYLTYQDKKIDEKKLSYSNYKQLCQQKIKIKCKECKNEADVITETLDTFFDSSWYFMKYLIKENFNLKDGLEKLPITQYIGGIEHANLHLLYARAIIKGLSEELNITTTTPFENIINQGLIHSQSYKDKNNKYINYQQYQELLLQNQNPQKYKMEKMSKSKKNIINPQNIIEKYSTSALRIMILSNYPIESCYNWDNQLIQKSQKLVDKIYTLMSYMSEIILKQKAIENIEDFIITKHKDKLNKFNKELQYIYTMLENNKLNNYIAGIHIILKTTTTLINEDKCILQINYIFKHFSYSCYSVIPAIADYFYYITYKIFITDKKNDKQIIKYIKYKN